jgi:hypothetical protein
MELVKKHKIEPLNGGASLEEVLQYENGDVIDGFLKSFNVTKEEAQNIFKETLKWLWYCKQKESQGSRTIDSSLLMLDEMWHTFILYSVDYFKFCRKHFSGYIHHQPTTESEIKKFKKMSATERKEQKRKQFECVYELLGKDTFIQWYHVFPEEYPRDRVLELRKK